MTGRRIRVQADGYGVHLELTVEHAAGCTREELDRALTILTAQARAAHADRENTPC